MACKSLDDQVAVPQDEELRSLLDQFVCVRLVQMYGVDLARFQFDFSLTWAIFFANADGTLYGRYGTRSALRQGSARHISLAGFKRSIEATLALHKRYVKDPAAGKREVLGKEADLVLVVTRGDEQKELTLKLSRNWRRRLGDWRFINLGVCAQITGFNGRPIHGGNKRLAIRVQRVIPRLLAGVDLRRNDVIVAIDGKREAMNLGKLTEYLLGKPPGSELEITRRPRRREDGEKKLRLTLR